MPTSRFDPSGQLPGSFTRLTEPNRLWGANGVAFGPDGRLYVAQFLAGQISAVDVATGDVEVVVPLDSPVQTPDDLAFAEDGTMYIADLAPGRVWRRTPDGEYTLVSDAVQLPNGITCVGNRLFVNEMRPDGRLFELFPDGAEPVLLTGGLALGNAMQLGPDGHLYYPHMLSNQVWRIPLDGGVPQSVASDVDAPVAVRFDLAGTLNVLSRGPEGLITRIDLASGVRTLVVTGIAGLDNAAFDAENRMYVSSFARGGVTEIHDNGAARPVVRQGLNGPFGIATDRHGTVYAADHFSLAAVTEDVETVDVITGGLPTFVHGVAGDGETLHLTTTFGEVHTYDPERRTTRVRARGLGELTGIAVTQDGQLVVAATSTGRVLLIDKDDTVTTLAEDLDHPVGVAVAPDGKYYVSEDRLGQVIRLDDSQPVADNLGTPQGITITGDDLFTVDVKHRRLLRISLTTGKSTVEAENLPVGLPPGTNRTDPATSGMVGRPAQFADITAASRRRLADLSQRRGQRATRQLNPDPLYCRAPCQTIPC